MQDSQSVLVITLGICAVIAVLLFLVNLQRKKMVRFAEYQRHMLERNVMAMSHVLLSTIADQVNAAVNGDNFERDDSHSFASDKASAQAVLSVFTTWYNISVAPAVDMTPVFEDIMITKVDRVDSEEGTCLLIHLGQSNDVVKHFLPNHALQPFITSVRALSRYMEAGVNIKR